MAKKETKRSEQVRARQEHAASAVPEMKNTLSKDGGKKEQPGNRVR